MNNRETKAQSSLEDRVAALENRLETLIDNLASNNTTFLELLKVLSDDSAHLAAKQNAFKKCEDGICTRDPPSCKNKDKD